VGHIVSPRAQLVIASIEVLNKQLNDDDDDDDDDF